MSGKASFTEALVLDLIFKATTDATLASAAGSLTTIYAALHIGDPTDSGNQTSNEVTTGQYATYARVGIARSGAGWVRTGSSISPVSAINFPTTSSVGTGCTATHFSLGTASSGAGNLLYTGTITPAIVIPATTAGVVPQLTTATSVTEG